MIERTYLLDVTRLISRSWTGRRATGIDRVCYAYLARFAGEAQAVVQHAGVFRIFGPRDSDRLFELLAGPDRGFRQRLIAFAPLALARARTRIDGQGRFYLNVSHTEFDRASHTNWLSACDLRPIYLIHDLIPITHPEFCRTHAVERHRGRVENALRNAAGIIVNSRATAAELHRFSQTNLMPPVLAAPLAGARFPRRAGHAQPTGDTPYFLCLGTIEPRKNHATLLAVWRSLAAELGEKTPRLVIVGQWGAGSAALRKQLQGDALLQRHVEVLDTCRDEELGHLIAGARAVLLPSRAEGFGLPMVEALALGTPVIASDLASFREIGQGIPTLLDPLNVPAWKLAVQAFIDDCPARSNQVAAMPQFRTPTWADHFGAVEQWLDMLRHEAPPDASSAHRERSAGTASLSSNTAVASAGRWAR